MPPIPGLIFPLVVWNLVFSCHSVPPSSTAHGIWWAEGTKCISVISKNPSTPCRSLTMTLIFTALSQCQSCSPRGIAEKQTQIWLLISSPNEQKKPGEFLSLCHTLPNGPHRCNCPDAEWGLTFLAFYYSDLILSKEKKSQYYSKILSAYFSIILLFPPL